MPGLATYKSVNEATPTTLTQNTGGLQAGEGEGEGETRVRMREECKGEGEGVGKRGEESFLKLTEQSVSILPRESGEGREKRRGRRRKREKQELQKRGKERDRRRESDYGRGGGVDTEGKSSCG